MKELESCRICGQKVDALNHFYRSHHLKLEEYVLKYFPKRDLLDESPIPFKSPDQYFESDFSNKINLKNYLKQLPKNDAAEYCKQLIIKRKDRKQLIYTPFQVELASLPCFPPVHYLNTLFNYYEFCAGIGLKNKVVDVSPITPERNLVGDNYIIVDSRESQPLKFEIEYKVEKLDVGDYMYTGNPRLSFDRKSLPDFIGTISQGFDRFTRELERAESAGVYLIMIVENTLSQALSFQHLPWMKRVKTKATPEYIFHNLRSLLQRFPNFQVLFCDGRKEVKDFVLAGFLTGDWYTKVDLQLAYQLGKLK